MKIALLSDIHANLPALEACLMQCRQLGIEQIIVLGDIVGYGPDPEPVTQRIMELASQGALVIRGNHDEAIGRLAADMNRTAARALSWTREQLSVEAKQYLAHLPMKINDGRLLFVHGDASNPGAWNYVTGEQEARISLSGTSADIVFSGHVHVPALYCLSNTGKLLGHRPVTNVSIPLLPQRRWLAVVGSVGQPRDGNPAAAFCIFDSGKRLLTYHRVPYDVESVANRILATGLPESLATRLREGH